MKSKIVIFMGMIPCVGLAQVPDAGSMSRQQESQPVIQSVPELEKSPKLDSTNKKNQLKVFIRNIVISGDQAIIPNDYLQTLIPPAIGQYLDFDQIQAITNQITSYLRASGHLLAQAYLPEQDITEGNIQINIYEGHLEKNQQGQNIVINTADEVRLDKQLIEDRLANVINGERLQGEQLERALLLLNDLPGIDASASLEKGKQAGGSQMTVDVEEDSAIKANFVIDNYGNRYVGAWRGHLNGELNDAFGLGDQLTIGGTGSESLGQGRASYTLPVGNNGLEANINYSYLSYEIGREFQQLKNQGMSQFVGGGLRYPLIRSRQFSLWGATDYVHKNLRNNNLQEITNDRYVDNGAISLNAQSFDYFLGGGYTQYSYRTTLGQVDLSSVQADQSADRVTAKTVGFYSKHNFSLARLQKLGENFGLYFSANGQLAGKNLTSAEQFILGGPSGVRAYPLGEGVGDSGWVANVELRYDLPYRTDIAQVQLVGFFDVGHIKQNEQVWKNSVTNATGRNQYSLSGSGVGINVGFSENLTIRCSWAQSIGNNPGRAKNGNNSDGLNNNQQFWLQSIISF